MISASGPPELFGLPIVTLALVISILSFAIALVALIWQIVKHYLDGGRVKVYMNTAIWEPDVVLTTNRSGRFLLPNNRNSQNVIHGGALELAQLVIENPGRIPVTLHSPGLALSGHGRKNHSVVPRMFGTETIHGSRGSIAERAVRIEPYGRKIFLLDYWSVVHDVLENGSIKKVIVRGQVEVGGKGRRPQKSSWRRRWTVSQGMYTAIEGAPEFTPFSVIWGVMYRSLPTHEEANRHRTPDQNIRASRESLEYLVEEAMAQFEARPQLDQLAHALEVAANEGGERLIAFRTSLLNAYQELDRMEGHLTEWTKGLYIPRKDAESAENAESSQPSTSRCRRLLAHLWRRRVGPGQDPTNTRSSDAEARLIE